MKSKVLHSQGEKMWVLVFDSGDEVVSTLLAFAKDKGIRAAQLTALGGFREVTLGFFDLDKKEYIPRKVNEQVEVMSLIGNFAQTPEGESKLHAHAVVGKRDYTAHGGHLLHAIVNPTLEVMVTESPSELARVFHKDKGLALLKL
jgi:predicted DNA-binding protein with PD1-like motif